MSLDCAVCKEYVAWSSNRSVSSGFVKLHWDNQKKNAIVMKLEGCVCASCFQAWVSKFDDIQQMKIQKERNLVVLKEDLEESVHDE